MPRMIILRGLPASGKTTRANELAEKGIEVVSRDEIRDITGYSEDKVLKIENATIVNALLRGKSIVVDDTNLSPVRIASLREIGEDLKADIQTITFVTPPDVCIKRDAERKNPVGATAIWSMYHKYLKP